MKFTIEDEKDALGDREIERVEYILDENDEIISKTLYFRAPELNKYRHIVVYYPNP